MKDAVIFWGDVNTNGSHFDQDGELSYIIYWRLSESIIIVIYSNACAVDGISLLSFVFDMMV